MHGRKNIKIQFTLFLQTLQEYTISCRTLFNLNTALKERK